MTNDSGVIILSTFPNESSVLKVSKQVVKSKLCACVNFAKARSIYTWKGKLEEQDEFIALFKTTKSRATSLKSRIKKLHPYELPEIVEIKMSDVSEKYLSWMVDSTT